jgi:1-acyl-sn-glycerol-3-phosphate acyltransferase
VKATATDSFSPSRLVRAIRAANAGYMHGFHDVRVHRPAQAVPPEGPLVVVANHLSSLDPFVIQAHFPRLIHWMMAREYYDLPLARSLLDAVGVVPISRGQRDSTATRAALRILQGGGVLGIFPEGTFLHLPEEQYIAQYPDAPPVLEFHPGAVTFALRTKARILPVALDGTIRNMSMMGPVLHPQCVHLTYGHAYHPTEDVDKANADLRARVEGLLRTGTAG